MRHSILKVNVALSLLATGAQAAPVFGTIDLTEKGTFTNPVSAVGSVTCKAAALAAPDSSNGVNIGAIGAALALNSGVQSNSGVGSVSRNRTTFTCHVIVPYTFNSFANGQQIVIFYSAEGHDPATHPNIARQLLTLPKLPPNGATTKKTVSVTL